MNRHTVVILATTANDSSVATQVLQQAGFDAQSVKTVSEICEMMEYPIGALILAEESLNNDQLPRLQDILGRQESWSDLPIILMTSLSCRGSEFFSSSGNISILERPFSRTTLIRAVDVALRARRKQYEVRDLLRQQLRATQARDEFFATLSHELRTPVSVILGWLDVLRNTKVDSTTSKNALEILERNARAQKELIDDLLDMSRIITGKINFDFADMELGELIKLIVKGFQPEAEAKNIRLNLSLPPSEEPLLISGDSQRLTQAVCNLIANSIKFTPPAGHVNISLEANSERYSLIVEDSGIGIDPSFIPSIFDRLKQEDMSSTRRHGGLGLGLAITSYIIEAHHGVIEAFSKGRDQGTRMKIVLPRSRIEPLKPLASEPMHMTTSLKGARILAVDDCPDILDLLDYILKEVHAEVRLTESAQEALIVLDQFQPDIILSDIGMPSMDGYQFIQTVRKRSPERGGETPAIALTAYARDEERLRALRAGFQMHISKPISNKQLISAISSLIHRSPIKQIKHVYS